MNKQFLLALLASGALVGLGGCSEGDEATITIDAPTTDNSVVDNSDNSVNNSGGSDGDGSDGEETPAGGCPEGTTETGTNVCELSGTIASDTTLTAGNTYMLNGRVIVGNGNCELADVSTCTNGDAVQNVTLTIEAGVEVKGMPSSDPLTAAVLDINRGSKLMAVGTATAPIVFSSAVDDDYEGSGEWGGVQLSGFAPHNACASTPCNVDGEGAVNFIGGDNPADNSGMLKYVIITEGGTEISTGDEINGLSLNAVGSGTVMDFIQINDNLDDGVEFYGGNANIKHLVVSGAGDDSVDWAEGYQGNLQYVIVKQSANSGGEAFEMDTEGTLEFLSKPTVANVTVIADKAANEAEYSLNFKKTSAGFFHNTIVTVSSETQNTFTTCARIHDGAEENVGTSLYFNNWIQDCANGAGDQGILATVDMTDASSNINPVFANLNSLAASQASAARLSAPVDWAAVNSSLPESVADSSYLDATDYIGAVDPSAATAWWAGWTLEGSVGTPDAPIAGCPTGTTEVSAGVCSLPANISSDMRLTAGNVYQLEGRTIVGNGNCELADTNTCTNGDAVLNVTLTIDAGVEVKGLPSSDPLKAAVLDVNRGSKLIAIGTASAPIIFSSADSDYSGSGEWGGVQLSGYAPHNACDGTPCNVDGEGAVNFVGGDNSADNSGTLKYVVITEGGTELSTGDEINGLSLNAVGSGTVLDYIQINDNLDDGVEFYGGTVNAKHLVVTGAGDDSVDWDEGYQGNMQYVLVKQTANSGGEGFEMDTEGTLAWMSKPTLVNVTLVADKAADEAPYSLNFKKSSGGFFHNMVATVAADSANTFTACAKIHNGAEANLPTGELALNNWVQDCASDGSGGDLAIDGDDAALDISGNAIDVTVEAAALDSIYASQAAAASGLDPIDWTALEGVLALPNISNGDPQDFDASFFDETTYSGALNPDGSDPWWAGWVIPGSL